MRKKCKDVILEEYILISSMIKWIVLATIVGVVVGLASGGFLKLLDFSIGSLNKINYYYLLMPIAFFLSAFIIVKLAPEAEGHGTEKVIEAIHKRSGKIDIKVVPVKLVATVITIAAGGSAGKEGPCAQIGAGLASYFAKILKMDGLDRKRLVVCGVSAGFAGVFGTPIAGAIFAAEVLYVGKFSYIVLLPSLIASYISYFVNDFIGVQHHKYNIDAFVTQPVNIFFRMLLFGAFIGVVCLMFIEIISIVEYLFNKKLNISKPKKGLLGGLILIVIVLLFKGNTEFIGLGSSVINNSLSGTSTSGYNFFMKMITTSITLGSGGSGGILTPIFYIGATAGNAWASLLNLNISIYSAVGMVAALAACANTPIAAIIMAMELYGVNTASYASVACVVSYLIVGHKSVYPTQILAVLKTNSLDFEKDVEIGIRQKLEIKRVPFRKKIPLKKIDKKKK
ncbi:chloride channel protein [Clostridium sp. DL1XJH146]